MSSTKASINESKLRPVPLSLKLTRASPSKNKRDISYDITPEVLATLINTNEFISKVINTLKELYTKKEEKYTQILNNLPPEEDTSSSPKKSKKTSPELIIKDMIQLTREAKKKHLTTKVVRENLMEAVFDQNNGIVSISGERRKHIRNHLCKQLFMLSKGYQPFTDLFLNVVFMGPSGVGKSKVAQTFAFVYSKSGILLKSPPRNISVLSPKDFIGGFVGQTSTKTANLLLKCVETVIFLDEAYSIMNCVDGQISKQGESYGPEAITEIVNYLDKYIGLSIMIVAGYEREINGCFLAANEGLNRRFPYKYVLPRYTPFDLLKIFTKTVNKSMGKNIFSKEIINYIYSFIQILDEKYVFNNQAGDMLNLVGMFYTEIFGNLTDKWNSDYNTQVRMVNNTFENFLETKNLRLKHVHKKHKECTSCK